MYMYIYIYHHLKGTFKGYCPREHTPHQKRPMSFDRDLL